MNTQQGARVLTGTPLRPGAVLKMYLEQIRVKGGKADYKALAKATGLGYEVIWRNLNGVAKYPNLGVMLKLEEVGFLTLPEDIEMMGSGI